MSHDRSEQPVIDFNNISIKLIKNYNMVMNAEEFLNHIKSKYTSKHFQRALNGLSYKSLEDTEMVKVCVVFLKQKL